MAIERINEGLSTNDFTPSEPWTVMRTGGHQYDAQADYVKEALGEGPGKCLVIGSPIFELLALAKTWDTTYIDVRLPPAIPGKFIQGDASRMDFGENQYDVASSTCVLCHAGTGRYGDEKDKEADAKILRNVRKGLKQGGKFAVMFGPCYFFAESIMRGNTHKIYSIRDAVDMTDGYAIQSLALYNLRTATWGHCINSCLVLDEDYLSMTLIKI